MAFDRELKEIGNRISAYRQKSEMSQKELAAEIHVSNNHLSNIENGKSAPSFATFLAICKALKVSPSYLISGSLFLLDDDIAEKISRKSLTDKAIISQILDAFPDKGD